MAEAKRDENGIAVLMATSSTTGLPTPVLIEHATGYVLVAVSTTSHSTLADLKCRFDDNGVPTVLGLNSSTDQPATVTVDQSGNLKVSTA